MVPIPSLHYLAEIGLHVPRSLKEQFWALSGSLKAPGSLKVLGSLKVPYKAAYSFFETNREVPAFFFQNRQKISLIQILDPRAKKVTRKPNPSGSENVRISGVPRGMVRIGID